jgi:hypothetical protein
MHLAFIVSLRSTFKPESKPNKWSKEAVKSTQWFIVEGGDEDFTFHSKLSIGTFVQQIFSLKAFSL